MLNVKLALPLFEGQKSFLECPACGRDEWFYNAWPRRCEFCGYDLPSYLSSAMFDIQTRIFYHQKGD